jgi:hypothetical protein
MNKKIVYLMWISTLAFLFSPFSYAKIINLYTQPKTDAKVLTTLDLDKPVSITIINKDKEWTSIVDPTVAPINARIAWVKTADLPTSNYSFTQTMVNSGKGPQGYVVQYGVPKPLTPEQAAKITKQVEMQQQAIANYLSTMTRNMFNNIQQFDANGPYIMPVIVMPTPATPAQNKPAVNKQTGGSHLQKQN